MEAAAISGRVATVLGMTGMAPHQAGIGYFVLGVIGGLLPDIDSPTSIPIRITFNVLGVVAGFLLVFTFGARYSLLELIILWLGCYFGIRHGPVSYTHLDVYKRQALPISLSSILSPPTNVSSGVRPACASVRRPAGIR